MESEITRRLNCRICGQSNFTQILSLGAMPPANAFIKKEELAKEEKKYPLDVYYCHGCHLLQLLDIVNPALLFSHYDYLTSASKPLSEHFVNLGKELSNRFINSKNELFVEIGGNDGVMLHSLLGSCRVLNIEPALRIAEISRNSGVETLADFFSEDLAKEILAKYGQAKIVSGSNVFAHIDDLADLFKGVKILIGEDGIFVMEVHHVGNLIAEGGFDQIYHEHLSYFSLHSLKYFVEAMGLRVFDIVLTNIHGQSMQVYISKNKLPLSSVDRFIAKEKELGLDNIQSYLDFTGRVKKNIADLRQTLLSISSVGKTIAGYGAPAKGNTLLNVCGIDNKIIDYIIDTTVFKQGLFAPGSKIPVLAPEKFKESPPDYTLLLAWNYADVILEKEEAYRKNGGKFIIPVPSVKLV
ncbi:MAG: class I SAM-dependent methyltransferase [Candidatus Komeilibacteria bacterium]|nr:class I SAM-dependent methyltransferase [Candidatus Komeilibacteria bacterium]